MLKLSFDVHEPAFRLLHGPRSEGFTLPISKSAAHYSIFFLPALGSLLLGLSGLPRVRFSHLLKAKSCKELQFQGEKIAAGEFLHSRLSVPTADRLVSGDPFL